jgi:hypothetical protein
VILAIAAWAIAGDVIRNRVLIVIWLLPAIYTLLQFSTQLQTRYFQFWRGQSDDKRIAQMIRKEADGKPAGSMAISTNWVHAPALEFYRRAWRMTAIQPVERLEPTPLSGFDFYVLSGIDLDRVKETRLRTVFYDPDMEISLAEP